MPTTKKKIAGAAWKKLAAHAAAGAAVGGAVGYLEHPKDKRKIGKAALAGALTGGVEHASHDWIDKHYKESSLGHTFQGLIEASIRDNRASSNRSSFQTLVEYRNSGDLRESYPDDPTHEEMTQYLAKAFGDSEEDEVDREEAIHWFAADYHGGQGSNLYSALSTSPFRPGILARGPNEDGLAGEMYRALEGQFSR